MKRVLIFVIICLFSAAIFWIGGYNFDQRGPFVAYCVFMVLFAAIMGALSPLGEK
jgi:hypothetical protein